MERPTPYQRKDSLHQRAKREGYRSRAAYKLLELQRAYGLLRPGQRVADLGCWPGGWLQVAARAVGPRGRVVGVDLRSLDPPLGFENVFSIEGDLTEPAVAARVSDLLGTAADVLLCDAAPKLTGVRATDRAREEALLEAVEGLVAQLLRPGGDLVLKLLDSPEAQAVAARLRSHFASARTRRLAASRRGTSERYLVARGFRGRARAPRVRPGGAERRPAN